MKIKDFPLIKTLILFLLGFFIAYHIKIGINLLLILLLILTFFTYFFLKLKSQISSITITLSVIAMGCLVFSFSYYDNEKEIKLLDKLVERKSIFYGYVSKVDHIDDDKIQFTFDCKKIVFKEKFTELNQKFLVDFNLSDKSLSLNYFKKIIAPNNFIRISGNLSKPLVAKFIGDFDQRFYLKSKNISYTLNSNIYDDLNLVEENRSLFNISRHLSELREAIKKQIEQNFDFLTAAFIKGLFIAERSDIPVEIKDDFINSGVIHVLAVSGLHTGYIALILFALTGRFNKWLRLIFVAIGLYVFVHIANLSPSVIRASIMSVVVLVSTMLERKNTLLNSIALSALIILSINPLDIFNPAFQLSFFAVLSIAIIYPVLQDITLASKITGWKKYIADLVLISLAVSIGTFPFVAIFYQKFSFIALVANLIVIPLTGVILGGIILNLVALNLFSFAFSIYKLALTEVINFNFMIIKFFANLPFAYTSIKNFSTLNALIYFLMILAILYFLNRNYKPATKFLIVILLIFNYALHFDHLKVNRLNTTKDHLILIKLYNSNSIFVGNNKINTLKIFERNDSLAFIVRDLQKLDKIFWNMNFGKVQVASISSPAIWLKNDLRERLNQLRVQKLDDRIWLFGNFSKVSQHENNSSIRDTDYRFINNSFTEILSHGGWVIIISPVDLKKVKPKLVNQNTKIIYISPELDTLRIKNELSDFQVLPLNFEKIGMKVFELNNDELREVKWQQD